MDRSGDTLLFDEPQGVGATSELAAYRSRSLRSTPGMRLELRARVLHVYDAVNGTFLPLQFCDAPPFGPWAQAMGANLQQVYANASGNQLLNQSRSNGAWRPGGPTQIVSLAFPTVGTWYRYRVDIAAAAMTWTVLADDGTTVLGSLSNGSTPQNFRFPFAFGVCGLKAEFAWLRVTGFNLP